MQRDSLEQVLVHGCLWMKLCGIKNKYMANRRKFIKTAALGSAAFALSSFKTKIVVVSESSLNKVKKPIVLSTWNFGLQANEAAWKILKEQRSST